MATSERGRATPGGDDGSHRDRASAPHAGGTPGRRHAPGLAATLREYGRLMRLDRPIGTWLLLWPALWALWIAARGRPDRN